ncbi:MAG: lipoprotein-releasing ABC transporter permease subunit [Deltaproteobacteria bacterium]|jgi:lipoprotein-releasing system permease protein|nr:lipoprotein-releasing ABC transporter permease subunit [Deltaproteobacteria bacterium]
MSFELYIGRRYLRAKQKQAFVSLITILSIAGVMVGVMALIVVIAVMTGFDADLKARILGGQSQVMLMRHGGEFKDYRAVLAKVEKTTGVEAATPFVVSQAMLRSKSGAAGVVIRGIDPTSAGRVMATLAQITLPTFSSTESVQQASPSEPGIVLGKELARNLGVIEGDRVYLISAHGMLSPVGHLPAMKQFKVTGFFQSGMYEYDQTFAFIHINDAQRMLRMGDSVTGIDIRVDDIYAARTIAEKIISELGFPYWARDWMQMNQNLFRALKMERWVMAIILILIVLVAAFNIASSLIMLVMGKTRDIAILKAMGATNRSIRKIFVFNGMVIGAIGTFLGLCLGLLLCFLLKHYDIYELTGDIYYFTTTLPVKVEILWVLGIITAAMAICFLATLYPARQAAKLDPVEAIRYG